MNSNCFMKNKYIKLFFDIKKEDRLNICLGFTLFLTIMIAYYILKPLRGSTTIKSIGSIGMAYGYIISSITALLFSYVYNKISRRLKRDRLIIYTVVFFGLAFPILRIFFAALDKYDTPLFYVGDIQENFIGKLSNDNNNLSNYLKTKLNQELQDYKQNKNLPASLKKRILKKLNKILKTEQIWNKAKIDLNKKELSTATKTLIKKNYKKDKKLILTNRFILEDFYKNEIAKTFFWARLMIICMISFVLISLFSVTMVTNLWSLLNDIVISNDAKRFYSFICFGAMLGSTIGSKLTEKIVGLVGTYNLFLVCSAIIFCTIPLFKMLSNKNLKQEDKGFVTEEVDKQKVAIPANIAKKQILLIALVLVFGLISTTIGHLQFNKLVEKKYVNVASKKQIDKKLPVKIEHIKLQQQNKKEKKRTSSGDEMTKYFATVYGYMSYLGLFALLFLGTPIFKLIGPSRILFLQPILLLAAAVWFIMNPILTICAIFIILYGGLGYSIHQVSREMMYIPLARQYKYTLKNYVDVFGFRLAAGYGSIVVLIINAYEGGLAAYSYVILACSIFMSFSVYKIHKSYQYIIKNFYGNEDNLS